MTNKGAHFKVVEDKYIEVTGSFEIYDSSGVLLKNEGPAFLCRCGLSENKPFCDGSHVAAGFKSD